MIFYFSTEELTEALKARGIETEIHSAIKNGITLTAVCIQNGSRFSPTFYTELLQEEFQNAEEAADFIVTSLASLPLLPTQFDPAMMEDPGTLLSGLYIGLEPDSDEDIVKRPGPFPGTKQYLYLKIIESDDEGFSVKIREEHIRNLGISAETAWHAAEEHSFAEGETVISKLEPSRERKPEANADQSSEDGGFALSDELNLYIATSRHKIKGAAAVLDKKAIKKYFDKETPDCNKLVAIPCSIHEVLIIPTTDEHADDILERCNKLVGLVNNSCVPPVERLANECCML